MWASQRPRGKCSQEKGRTGPWRRPQGSLVALPRAVWCGGGAGAERAGPGRDKGNGTDGSSQKGQLVGVSQEGLTLRP